MRHLRDITVHRGPSQIAAAFFGPRAVVSASNDHTIRVWNTDEGESRVFMGINQPIDHILVTPGSKMIARSRDTVYMFRGLANSNPVLAWKAESSSEYCAGKTVAVSAQFVVKDDYRGIKVYDLETGKLLRTIPNDPKKCGSNGAVFRDDDKTLVTSRLKFWDVSTGKPVRSAAGAGAAEDSDGLAISDDGKRILTYNRGQMSVREVDSGDILWGVNKKFDCFSGHSSAVFGDLGTIIFSCNSTLFVYRSRDGQELYKTEAGKKIGALAVSTDGERLLTIHEEGVVGVWQIDAFDFMAEKR
jgi:WD40 repeat protein